MLHFQECKKHKRIQVDLNFYKVIRNLFVAEVFNATVFALHPQLRLNVYKVSCVAANFVQSDTFKVAIAPLHSGSDPGSVLMYKTDTKNSPNFEQNNYATNFIVLKC